MTKLKAVTILFVLILNTLTIPVWLRSMETPLGEDIKIIQGVTCKKHYGVYEPVVHFCPKAKCRAFIYYHEYCPVCEHKSPYNYYYVVQCSTGCLTPIDVTAEDVCPICNKYYGFKKVKK